MIIERHGLPPTPKRPPFAHRSYDNLRATEFRSARLKYRHNEEENIISTSHPSYRYSNDHRDILIETTEQIPRRKTMDLTSGFRRTFSVRNKLEPEGNIETDDDVKDSFATVRGAPYGRRRSLSKDRSLMTRSSSESDVRMTLPRATTTSTPRLSRCLRALGGSWKNLLLRECNEA